MQILNLRDVPDFLPQLALWHQAEWSHFNPGEDLRARIARMQVYLNTDFIPSTYVAIENGVLGSAAIVAHDMDTHMELSPWLASVYVAPEYRRRGIACALINHVLVQAKQHAIEQLYLFTPNHADYYARLGWLRQKETVYRGNAVTIMSIEIDCKQGNPDLCVV